MKQIKIIADTFIIGKLVAADPDKVHELEDSLAQTLVAAFKAEFHLPEQVATPPEEQKEAAPADKSDRAGGPKGKDNKVKASKKKKRKEK